MRKTTEGIAAYGIVNGLGFGGDPEVKAKLLRRVGRALGQGDVGRLLEYLVAYGFGNWVGSSVRNSLPAPSDSESTEYSNSVYWG